MIKIGNVKIKILHLEDLSSDAELVERELKKGGIYFEKIVVDNKKDFENALNVFPPDIILSDHSLPSFDSISALQIVKEKGMQIPFILITSTMTDEFAVKIMLNGADDYIIKDRLTRLPSAILNAIEKFRLQKEKENFSNQIAENEKRFRALIEKSSDMKMLTTLDGKFLYGSPSITKVLGYALQDFLFHSSAEFFHPDDLPNLRKNKKTLLAKPGESLPFQYRILHKNKNWIWCEGTLTNLLHEPSINAFVSNFRDISERKKSEEEILEKNKQLKSLSNHLQTIREEERKNVAREIHDELGQHLTALKLDIDWILHKQTNPDPKVIIKLHEMLDINDGIINTVRRISSDLRPALLDDLGLIATIEWKCADFEERSGVKCQFISKIKERKFSKDFSIHMYRILQESLTNVNRHSGANKVAVILAELDNNLVLEIQDNGKGITPEHANNSKRLGILGMKERAGLLNGKLEIIGKEKKGTCIKLILSLENEYTDS
ncbi:MAG: PAS domain S-box protein [Bacteroidota bacterium]